MRWSLNTMPNFLNCNRFKEICNFWNDVLQAFGSVLSSYYNVVDFNKLCDENCTIAALLLNINCRGLSSKYDLLISMLNELKVKPAVLTFTKTWFTKDDVNLANLPNYTLHSYECQNQKGGGVCIFIANAYTVSDKRSGSHMSFEYIDLIVNSKYGKPLFISVIYRTGMPPNA